MRELAMAICEFLRERKVGRDEGEAALTTVLIAGLSDRGVNKRAALAAFAACWDCLVRAKQYPRGEDYKVEIDPDAQAALDDDPELATQFKDVMARVREALDGVATGRFASVDEAMKAMGATQINLDDLDDD
jgi:hypothetical protein